MRYVILFIFLICCTNKSNAQMKYKGQSSISINGGAASKGFYGNVNYQNQITDKGAVIRADFDYTYTSRNIPSVSGNIESNVSTLGVAYSYRLPEFLGNRFFVQPYIGGFGGLENYGVDNELIDLIDGSTKDGFVYGLYGGIELEYNLSNSISIVVQGSHYYNLKSDINENLTKGGAGLKFYF